ncbi:MAG TPA: metallophosphoesterase family protein [Anaerolineales bacterium]|nr:metallophosphoesterase family protein [Anaerolineales bacterium]
MKIALFSDIHANPWALEAVLNCLAKRYPVDQIWHLGDLVGYGPEPVEVVELAMDKFDLWIAGNHDERWLEFLDLEKRRVINLQTGSIVNVTEEIFNLQKGANKKDAIDSWLRHLKKLHTHPAAERWLQDSMARSEHHGPQVVECEGLKLIPVHAAPSGPTELYNYPWTLESELIQSLFRVNERLLYYEENGVSVPYENELAARLRQADLAMKSGAPYLVLFGHSHVPGVYRYEQGRVGAELPPGYGVPVPVGNSPMAINPGSVGHPSDLDPRAAFAILDTGARLVTFHRVPYPIKPVVDKLWEGVYQDNMRIEIETARLRTLDVESLGIFHEKLKQLAASPDTCS